MTTVDELVASNPFPGLRPFAISEADRFFGRRQQIEELAARLDEVCFVAVAGSSGCGKSSLVLAGLLGELQRRTGGEDETVWRSVVMRPGNQPISNLAERLSPLLRPAGDSEGMRAGTLYGQLRLGGLGLVEAVHVARLEPHTRVLVVVDQFEEIFRFKRMTDADEASAFIKLLLNAGHDPRSPVSVVITLRSDTLGYCADFRDLPETINRGQYLVPKLTREQRKETIVKPVELRGVKIAPRLVQRLLNDVSDDFDDLPVMQHALTRTWSRWALECQGSRPIDLEDYEAVGTTRQALSNHADEAFESLTAMGPVVEKVFRALTEHVTEGTEIRRPLDLNRLCQVVGADRMQVEPVIERFRRPDTAFLMPPAGVALADNPVIDISHESLIRQWQRLRHWVQAESESRAMLLRLVEAARRYEAKQGSLWRGPDLAKALEWQRTTKPTPAWVALYAGGDGASTWETARTFLAESAKDAGRERRRLKLIVAGMGGLALTVGISVIATIILFRRHKQATSLDLANRALVEIDQDPARSAYLALTAVDQDPDNASAEYALRQSLASLEAAHAERILSHDKPVSDARFTQDGSRLVVASGKDVLIYDTRTFERVGPPISRDTDLLKAWLIANNTVLVTHTSDDQGHWEAQIQGIGDPSVRRISCQGVRDPVSAVNISADERHVALGCVSGDVLVWDATDAAAPQTDAFRRDVKSASSITALAFSTDGEYLASGDARGEVIIWKLGHRGMWIPRNVAGGKGSPIKQGRAIRDVAFHPHGPGLLATAGDDYQAVVWALDLERRRLDLDAQNQSKSWPLLHDRPVIAAKFAPRADNENALITVSDKRVRVWHKGGAADPMQIRLHEDWVLDANASPDGELLATASSDGAARIWSTRSKAPVAVLRGHHSTVTRAFFSPDGQQVVTASPDGTVRIWRIGAPRLLSYSPRWTLSAAFEPGGTRVAVGEEDGWSSLIEIGNFKDTTLPHRRQLQAVEAQQIGSMCWSKDRSLVAGRRSDTETSWSPQAMLWEVDTGKDATPGWLKKYTLAVFSPGTDELLTLGQAGQIVVWDAKSLQSRDPRPRLELGGESVRSLVAMSPDGRWIAADEGNTIVVWNREKPQVPTLVLTGHRGTVNSLEFSRDSKCLVTASHDHTARIWPMDPHSPQRVLRGHTAGVFSASFDADGKLLVTGSADSTIRVWDAATGLPRAVLRWHGEGVNQVQFSADGKRILSASDDGTVRLGECEACTLAVKGLREKVPELAKLSDDDLMEIQRETDAVKRFFKLPAFLAPDR